MLKKIMAIITALLIFCCVPVFAGEEMIINGDFEREEVSFTNISAVQNADGTFSGVLKSETVPDENGKFIHISEYLHTITLVEGKMYEVTMEVAEDSGDGRGALDAECSFGEGRLKLKVTDAGSTLTKISAAFVASSSGEVSLEISAETKSRLGLLIDNISIKQSDREPAGMEIIGTRNAFVPPYDNETYEYSAVAVDESGNIISGIYGGIEFDFLPEGVISADGKITVTNKAVAGETFLVKTVANAGSAALPQKEIEVKLVNNYIENGNFEDYPKNRGFEAEVGNMEIVSDFSRNIAKISSVESDYEYKASILVEKTYALTPGKMYVLRAKAYSEAGFTSRYTEVSKGQFSPDGFIDINISNLGEEETEIVSVIRVLSEGIYKIRLNFTNSDTRNVFIYDIGLFEEQAEASEILIKAPAHISLSDRDMKVPLLYAARDQEGNVIPNMPGITMEIVNGNDKVYLEGGYLYVLAGAKAGVYTLIAESEKALKRAYVEVSAESVGDGGFEKYSPGEWISTAEPSSLHFVDYKNYGFDGSGEKAARLTMGGPVSAVLSDSVYNFKGGQVYVFGGNFMPLTGNPLTLSLLLCDAEDVNFTQTIAVLQTTIEGGKIKAVFTPPRDMAAKLMLGFTDESGGQTLLFDDLYLEKAAVYCDGVSLTGYPYVDKILTGRHNLHANFDAVDISTYRWLISKEKNGIYLPIEGYNDKSITLLEDMVNSYIKLEVTPVTLNGPVFGESVTSEPVLITHMPHSDGGNSDEFYEEEEPFETEDKPSDNGPAVIDIYSADISRLKPFFDIENHWAKDDINILSAAAIVNGKKNQLFMPDDQVTRAEFAAFIARAFGLESLEYSGTFDDVKAHHWYSGAVEIISKYGIANGVGYRRFMPDEPITREQIAAMVIRALAISGKEIEGEKEISFTDSDKISGFAEKFVSDGVRAGIIQGFDDGTFKPQQTATRAEAVVMIKRMITYILSSK